MHHTFTDRDGVIWSVEWCPGERDRDPNEIPQPEPDGLYFTSERREFFVPMAPVDPAELPDEELQAMVDREFEG